VNLSNALQKERAGQSIDVIFMKVDQLVKDENAPKVSTDKFWQRTC